MSQLSSFMSLLHSLLVIKLTPTCGFNFYEVMLVFIDFYSYADTQLHEHSPRSLYILYQCVDAHRI